MTRRAELVDETRQRITEAAARLHTTVGPSNTSVASIAEEAGVTRLTVYRHFPDIEVLFAACRAHWRAQNPPPDPRSWPDTRDFDTRARRALTEHYAWYRDHADELFPIYRDMTTMPPAAQEAMRTDNVRLGDLLVSDAVPEGLGGQDLRAVARHLLDYRTWRSLAINQELGDAGAVNVGVRMLTALATEVSRARSQPSRKSVNRSASQRS